jgi:lysozyme
MKISEAGVNLIKRFEGVRNRPYRDCVGLWTVGVGHLIGDGKSLPKSWDKTFTDKEVDELLLRDLSKFERGITMQLPMPLRQCEYDALCSFAFNLGLGTLQRSTIRQAMLRRDKKLAAEYILKYCRAGGKIVRGLQLRRLAEYKMFLG